MTNTRRALLLLVGLAILSLLSVGCVNQTLRMPELKANAAPGEKFENSDYSVYLLFDLIKVSEAKVPELIAEVNPDKKAVQSVEVTSSENWLAWLVNILNGGIIDRGIIVSLNHVKVEGNFAK